MADSGTGDSQRVLISHASSGAPHEQHAQAYPADQPTVFRFGMVVTSDPGDVLTGTAPDDGGIINGPAAKELVNGVDIPPYDG